MTKKPFDELTDIIQVYECRPTFQCLNNTFVWSCVAISCCIYSTAASPASVHNDTTSLVPSQNTAVVLISLWLSPSFIKTTDGVWKMLASFFKSCSRRYFGQCIRRRKSSADIFICGDIFDLQLAIYTLSQIHDCSHHLFIYIDGDVQSRSEMHIFTCGSSSNIKGFDSIAIVPSVCQPQFLCVKSTLKQFFFFCL